MERPKRKYLVYAKYYLESEFPEDSFEEDWKLVGETFAVSEKQAINNVRFKLFGNYCASQYKPTYSGGHYSYGLHYKAILYKED